MKEKYPIYLSSWSLRDLLMSGVFNFTHLAAFAKFNDFHGVELVDQYFDSLKPEFTKPLIQSIKQMSIEATLSLTTDFTIEEPEQFKRQVNYVLEMINFASELEAKSVRILVGGTDFIFQKWFKKIFTPKKDSTMLESIKKQKSVISILQTTGLFQWIHKKTIQNQKPKPLTNQKIKESIFRALDYILPNAEKKSVNLAIENHWGVTSLTENILEIIGHYSSQFLGTCPDFGNFTVHQDRYTELKKLIPYAKEVHAKTYRFDNNGEETSIDYCKCISLLKQSNFQSPLVVEYEGKGDLIKNSLKTKELLLRYL